MKKWQLAFDGAPSAQAEFGLKQISAAVFRHAGYKPELAPEETGRNAIALSIATNDANIPENGYRLRVEDMTNGRQRVLIQGKDDSCGPQSARLLRCGQPGRADPLRSLLLHGLRG